MSTNIILASSSAYRQKQLRQFTSRFTTINPDIDESRIGDESALKLSKRLSQLKAETSYSKLCLSKDNNIQASDTKKLIIIASDQTAEAGSLILGKPLSIEVAKQQLRSCSGKTVFFYSSISVLSIDDDVNDSIIQCSQKETSHSDKNKTDNLAIIPNIITETTVTKVVFRDLSEKEITSYVNADEPMHCAGSFKSESRGLVLFDSVTSPDPSALIGLPLISLNKILLNLGVNLLEY